MFYRFGTLAVALAFFLVGCTDSLVSNSSASNDELANRDQETTTDSALNTIVGTALDINASSGEFSYLIEALTRVDEELEAGLIPMLDGNRQFTVFAPNDAAFDAAALALGFANGEDLVSNLDIDLLAAVLSYHVAPGNRTSGSVTSANRVRTVSKGFVFPYVDNAGNAYLTDSDVVLGAGSPDAQIVLADVFASNGVIHVIDWVLLP